ncbi:MAG: xylulokinase [Lachnospiraceae bacterium]|nr:xylulokinase [Lachnospiraceae bacterium]
MASILGIDLGTSSIKAMLLDTEKGVIGIESRSYDVEIPALGYAQQSPREWWESLCAISQALKEKYPGSFEEIKAIGLSGQMHGLVLTNKKGEVLRPAILWLDQRSGTECGEIMERVKQENWEGILQNRVFPGFAFPSLLWVKRQEPEIYRNIHKLMQPKDYIRYRLTGEIGAEVSDASASLMFDLKRREWAYSVTESFGIEAKLFPECRESMEIGGYVTKYAQKETGLKAGIPVIYGAGDQPCQSIGNGVYKEGQVICNIGTGGQISVYSDTDRYDRRLRTNTFCHCYGKAYTMFGAMLCAGMALKWLKNNLLREESFQVLSQQAGTVPPGSEGVLFLPYLAGERTPHMDPMAKGMFYGLQLCHGREHFIRAVMEGITFGLKDSLDILEEMGMAGDEIIASGGASVSPVWIQMQADIFQKKVRVSMVKEQACLGACILAGVGCGLFSDIQKACGRFVKYEDKIYLPEPEGIYQKYHEKFRELYDRNKERDEKKGEIS